MGNRGSAVIQCRKVQIGKYENKYPDNRVISYKYTVWNFLFKNLFEQFRRVANFYFLLVGILAGVIPDTPVSSWATLGPLILVVTVSAIKQGYEDYLRHQADNKINNTLVTVVRGGVAQEIACKRVCVGDIVRVNRDEDIPCDLVMLISSHEDSRGFITTANLDGETNLKMVESPIDTDLTVDQLPYLEGTITCDPPTVDLYQFSGDITLNLTKRKEDFEAINPVFIKEGFPMEVLHGESCRCRHRCSFRKLHFPEDNAFIAPLTADNLLLRGAQLRNTEFVFGCAVYTGRETKLALNSTLTINKFSIVEKSINKFLFFFFVLLVNEVLLSVVLTSWSEIISNGGQWYIGTIKGFSLQEFMVNIFVFLVLYYYIIPISLYVNLEIQRFCGTLFFEWDLDMFANHHPAISNTSDLNEELGQLQYLLSDKTGTLTENDMLFRQCSIEGSVYCDNQGELLLLPPTATDNPIALSQWPSDVEQFLIAMALCHSVQMAVDASKENPCYQASSPDEKALVEAAARCGVVFLGLEGDSLLLSVKGQMRKYRKLQTLEFSSERKRMSVVVSDPSDRIWLFCKGAETTMMPLMISGHQEETHRHYTEFSMQGLRTLVFGMRQLGSEEYNCLIRALKAARGMLDRTTRESTFNQVCSAWEKNLHLQGATAVEDRLQDGVPSTLELLRTAGIKVWVLTGDKVETALNIAYSCGHFNSDTRRLDLLGITNETDCIRTLQDLRFTMAGNGLAQYGLVVDGTSIRLALLHDCDTLRDIALNCTSVLCCRLSPKQKAELVRLVKKSEGRPLVAAIGDGANDVSMIQEANIGLGIIGKEGRQAVRCSDFAFAKFHCVAKAILVHGHWYYLRGAIFVLYFFYKNIVFITPQVYFSLLNGESPQPIYVTAFLLLYNTIFTAAPIIVYSLFEQNFTSDELLSRPELYKINRNNRLMSWQYFFLWMAIGLWHSVVVYFVPARVLAANPVVLSSNTPLELKAFGVTVFHNVVLIVNLKILVHSTFWTPLFLLSVGVTLLGFFFFCCVYNMVCITWPVFQSPICEMHHVYFQLLSSPTFWIMSVLIVVLSLLPDVVISVVRFQKFRRPNISSWFPTRRKGIFVLPALERM